MKMMSKRSFIVAAAVFALGISFAHAGKVLSEDELIAQLASPKEGVVAEAMQKLEKQYPTSTKGTDAIKKYLTDPREKVRSKAGRVLGALHAEVSTAELASIAAGLKANSAQEVMEALKSLRGLKAQSTVPEIVPLLKHSNIGVIRDACRTLAVLGGKSNVADIEPLLSHPDAKVQKDAQDAIFTLKNK